MLERIDDLPAGILGVRASGRVSREDYEAVIDPLLAEAGRAGRRIRFLYHFAPDFEAFTPGAAWEDAKVGLQYLRLFERCAVVTDKEWLRGATQAFGAMMPCPVRVFGETELDAARGWLAAPSVGHLEHRLLEEAGVLVVEPHGRLSVEDFDAIGATVDPWIESGRTLRGIVVHAREFPGWETIGSFFRHVRFVRDHHRKVRRVAVAVDGKLAKLAPALVESFVGAEVQHFGFDDFERAIAWAGEPAATPESTAD